MERQTFIQEMSVNFNLRNRNTDRPTAIFAVVYLQGKQYKFPTGVKVYPHQWNKRKQHAILSLQLTELDNLNNKLCNEALNRYRNNFEDFKNSICTDTSKFENITKYLHSYMSTPSKKKKTKTEIPPLVYMKDRVKDKKTYLSAFNQFEKWLKSKKITLSNWSDLTLKTIQDYNSYILSKDYSAARYNMLIIALRIPIKAAYKDPSVPFKDADIKEFLEDANKSTSLKDNGKVALSSEQVETIYNLPLKDRAEREVRDMFVFQCLTSLRASNILGADFTKHKGKRQFEVVQVKEKGSFNQVVSLDLDPKIETILGRNDWKFKDLDIHTHNKIIEAIVKQTPFANDTITIKTKLASGKIKTTETPLYKAIRSHSGRRTFITEMRSNPNIQDRDLVQFTGHANIELLATYDKTSKQTSVNNILQAKGKAERSGAIQTLPSHPFFALYDYIYSLINSCSMTEAEMSENVREYAKQRSIYLGSTEYYTAKRDWSKTYNNTIAQRYGQQAIDIDRVLFRAETGVAWD